MIALHPEPLFRLRAPARRRQVGAVTSLPGGLVTRPRGRGLETAELRPFAPGDDPRHLDRNATARTGTPQVRLFHAERDRTTILMADFRPSMLWGTRRTLRSIAAAEALAIEGWQAIAEGGRVGLIAVTADQPVLIAPRARDRAMVRVIGAMVAAHAAALAALDAADPPLADALALAHRVAPRGAEVVLASALETPGAAFDERVLSLKSRTDLQVVYIADAFETAPPPGRYRFSTRRHPDGAEGRPVQGADRITDLARRLDLKVRIHDAAHPPEAAHA